MGSWQSLQAAWAGRLELMSKSRYILGYKVVGLRFICNRLSNFSLSVHSHFYIRLLAWFGKRSYVCQGSKLPCGLPRTCSTECQGVNKFENVAWASLPPRVVYHAGSPANWTSQILVSARMTSWPFPANAAWALDVPMKNFPNSVPALFHTCTPGTTECDFSARLLWRGGIKEVSVSSKITDLHSIPGSTVNVAARV
jgi:hypothetical protein